MYCSILQNSNEKILYKEKHKKYLFSQNKKHKNLFLKINLYIYTKIKK